MKIGLTKYGLPQVVILPAVIIATMLGCLLAGGLFLPSGGVIVVEVVLAIVLVWGFAFFRDPERAITADKNILLSPADGKVADIETVEENNFINWPALRIGIFLNIFNVHINRAPCDVKVEQITYKAGKYKNAANADAGRVNEANRLDLIRTDSPEDRLIVRQISGAIARRIVCRAQKGQKLAGGEKFGMIKFGSRTELYIPAGESIKLLVKRGDKVKAGITALVRYE